MYKRRNKPSDISLFQFHNSQGLVNDAKLKIEKRQVRNTYIFLDYVESHDEERELDSWSRSRWCAWLLNVARVTTSTANSEFRF